MIDSVPTHTQMHTHQTVYLLLCIQSNRGSCRSEWTTSSSTSSLVHLWRRSKQRLSSSWRSDTVCVCGSWPAGDLCPTCHIWFKSTFPCIIRLNRRPCASPAPPPPRSLEIDAREGNGLEVNTVFPSRRNHRHVRTACMWQLREAVPWPDLTAELNLRKGWYIFFNRKQQEKKDLWLLQRVSEHANTKGSMNQSSFW